MIRIKFLKDYTVQPWGPTYRQGQQVTLKTDSARHFLRKAGVAEEVTEPPPAPAPRRGRPPKQGPQALKPADTDIKGDSAKT